MLVLTLLAKFELEAVMSGDLVFSGESFRNVSKFVVIFGLFLDLNFEFCGKFELILAFCLLREFYR